MKTEKTIPYKIYLDEQEMPKKWYNVRADMKNKPAPLLNPGTLQPMTAEELGAVFCDELVQQELDNDTAYIDIPQEILDFYKMYRPSPLVRAYCLEEKLQTPAKIYYKFEGNNTSGSHKLNSAIAQAYYAKKQGLKGVTTETGAGQWGTALSMACAYLGLDCNVYMVKVSYEQKPFRREVMRTYGCNRNPLPLRYNGNREEDSGGASRHNGQPWLCHFRSRRNGSRQGGLSLCSGQRAESGSATSVHHRYGNKGSTR